VEPLFWTCLVVLVLSQRDPNSLPPKSSGSKGLPQRPISQVGLDAEIGPIMEGRTPVGSGEVGLRQQIRINEGRRGKFGREGLWLRQEAGGPRIHCCGVPETQVGNEIGMGKGREQALLEEVVGKGKVPGVQISRPEACRAVKVSLQVRFEASIAPRDAR